MSRDKIYYIKPGDFTLETPLCFLVLHSLDSPNVFSNILYFSQLQRLDLSTMVQELCHNFLQKYTILYDINKNYLLIICSSSNDVNNIFGKDIIYNAVAKY